MASQALKIAALAAISTLVGLSAAQAGVTSVVCGALIKSIARTNSPGWNSSSTTFVSIPSTPMNITIPAGEPQCVRVRFSAQMRCLNGNPECFVRALAGNLAIDPPINGISFSKEETLGTRSFEWVKRLDPGTYQLKLQAAVQDPASTFNIQVWTMSVDILK